MISYKILNKEREKGGKIKERERKRGEAKREKGEEGRWGKKIRGI